MKKDEAWLKQIPNMLSFMRLLMIGVFVFFFKREEYWESLAVYVLAVLTDLLDGYLARHYNWITDLGKVLDPLADKLMLITTLFCFYSRNWIPLWLGITVAIKEIIMICGGFVLFKNKIFVFADWFGKLATGFFNAGVILTLLKSFFQGVGIANLVCLSVAMLMAILALIHYTNKNVMPYLKKEYQNKQFVLNNKAKKPRVK